MDEDTIVAISTAGGPGAIAIVRLSGPDALEIVAGAFKPHRGGDIRSAETFSLTYGHVVDPECERTIDEALVGVMLAPRSYTREDVIEVHCHGGVIAVRAVLELMVRLGARIAQPGEFTRRAFVNGRIDLSQAESVADVVSARSSGALRAALHQLDGGLSGRLAGLRSELVGVLAMIEAGVDFSDEDVGEIEWDGVRETLDGVATDLERLLGTSLLGRALHQGVRVAIVGQPNVGKSSLLNALVMRERAIVSEEPGTTRDTVEDEVEVEGIPIRLVDTAGMRDRGGEIERLGMDRSRKTLEQAEVVVVVMDLTDVGADEGLHLIEGAKGRPCIVVGNKADLVGWDSGAFESLTASVGVTGDDLGKESSADGEKRVWVRQASAKSGEGVDGIRSLLGEIVAGGRVEMEEPILVAERHRSLVAEAKSLLEQGMRGIDTGTGEELVAEDVRAAAAALGAIIGEELGPDLLDEIFGRFCVGK